MLFRSVSAVQQAADNAAASERAAIQAQMRSEAAADRADAKVDDAINNGANLIRNEVKQDADRAVSARQAAAQSESNAAASENAAASSASNAATSETNAKQSETNAGDYAAVATTAATEAVDAMESANAAASSIGDSVNAAAGHADRASQHESGAAAYAQNASDAADRVGTADQIEGWIQQAQDAADRIGTAEQVEGWVDDARNSASSASLSESKAREYRDSAATAATSAADDVRIELGNLASDAADCATDSSRSAARARTSETNAAAHESNAATHEANSLSAAQRAEFAAEETIQQVEGDFATRNYVDDKTWQRGNVSASTTSIDQLPNGAHNVESVTVAGNLGMPTTSIGRLEIFGGTTRKAARWTPTHATSAVDPEPEIWIAQTNGSGGWSRWARITSATSSTFGDGALAREAIVSHGLHKRGGVIGTAGKGAVALRFSHHTKFFEEKIVPLLKKYRLPWAQVINPGNHGTGNDTMTWENLTREVHETGGEIWDHGQTHSNFTSESGADYELGTSLEDLRAAMPSVHIDCFAAYGSGDMMGLKGWDTPEKFATYGGKILLSKYFIVNGLFPGQVRRSNAQSFIGSPYAPLDNMSLAQVRGRVNAARDTQGAVMFMLHPNYLDQEGRMTTSQLDEALGYIAGERDAGRIRVLSTAGQILADSSAEEQNLLQTGTAGELSGTWSESVSTLVSAASYGLPHEAESWVKGTGEVTLKVVVDSPTRPLSIEHKVTLGGESQRLGVPITPPLDATSTVVSLSGNVRHTGIKYRPI